MGRYDGEEYGVGSVSENSWRQLKTQHRMMEDRAIKAEAERDALAAKLEAVERLADWFDAQENWREWGVGRQIRAAVQSVQETER